MAPAQLGVNVNMKRTATKRRSGSAGSGVSTLLLGLWLYMVYMRNWLSLSVPHPDTNR